MAISPLFGASSLLCLVQVVHLPNANAIHIKVPFQIKLEMFHAMQFNISNFSGKIVPRFLSHFSAREEFFWAWHICIYFNDRKKFCFTRGHFLNLNIILKSLKIQALSFKTLNSRIQYAKICFATDWLNMQMQWQNNHFLWTTKACWFCWNV